MAASRFVIGIDLGTTNSALAYVDTGAGEAESQRPSGIYVAETAKEKPQKGTVLAVGPGRWENGSLEPMNVQVGDTVLFAKYAGTEIKLDGEDYVILREEEILGVAEGVAELTAV